MVIEPTHWLAEQKRHQRQLLLIIDTLHSPEVIPTLFKLAPVRDYIRLFHGTEFEDLLPQSPWLIRIDSSSTAAIFHLLQNPTLNWGWLASTAQLDLNEIAQHWRDRLVISEDGQRWFYRFQDNQVIARHLGALTAQQIPLLLGPLAGVLSWDGKCWQAFENQQPAPHPEPFATPWLDVPESPEIADQIEHHALLAWLWEEYGDATQKLAEVQTLEPWLALQIQRARDWNWDAPEQKFFLLKQQLNPYLNDHPAWEPRPHETPEQHFARCQCEFSSYDKGRT